MVCIIKYIQQQMDVIAYPQRSQSLPGKMALISKLYARQTLQYFHPQEELSFIKYSIANRTGIGW